MKHKVIKRALLALGLIVSIGPVTHAFFAHYGRRPYSHHRYRRDRGAVFAVDAFLGAIDLANEASTRSAFKELVKAYNETREDLRELKRDYEKLEQRVKRLEQDRH